MKALKKQVFDATGFGQALKSKRTIQNNLTIRDASKLLSIPTSTISRMERGFPTEMKSILVACDWLEQSICDFIVLKKNNLTKK